MTYADAISFWYGRINYEVRAADEVFADVPKLTIAAEMLDLAKHIIDTKRGSFDPLAFDDRYEDAVAEMVKAKLAGKKIMAPKARKTTKVVDLMEALRQSAGAAQCESRLIRASACAVYCLVSTDMPEHWCRPRSWATLASKRV